MCWHTHGIHAVPVAINHHVVHTIHVIHAEAHAVVEAVAHLASHAIYHHGVVPHHAGVGGVCVRVRLIRGSICALCHSL